MSFKRYIMAMYCAGTMAFSLGACTTESLNLDDPIQAIQNAQLLRDSMTPKTKRKNSEGPIYLGFAPNTLAPLGESTDFSVDQKTGKINFHAEIVYFDYDSSDLTPGGKAQLDALARYMKNNPDTKLTIEGHCDSRGSADYNLVLGKHRSDAVRTYLALILIPEERLDSISFGKTKPVAFGQTEADWAKNRRVEFLLTHSTPPTPSH
ncbi:MAG: OmpA family protein [Chitinophagaceae bacterium]|nr:OmpA family protein [Oligoflexus sp.]